jgi:hypothetical protein
LLVIDHFISILFHVVILHDYWLFFEIPSFEELQDSNCSPRREEVGRPSLRVSGGFLTTFFYQSKLWVFTQQILLVVDELQKLPLTSLQTPRGWKNRTPLDEGYTSNVAIPLEVESEKKTVVSLKSSHVKSSHN